MYKKNNINDDKFFFPIKYGKFLSVYSVFFLVFTPLNILADSLISLGPADESEFAQRDSAFFKPSDAKVIRFKKSKKKDHEKEVSTAKWSNHQGFELISNYQENILDWREASSDRHLSNAIWNSKIKFPINEYLVASGEFNIGEFTSPFRRYNPLINSQKELNYLNERLDGHQVSQDLSNSQIKFGLSGKTSLVNYGFDYFSIGSRYDTFKKKVKKRDKAGLEYWVSRSFNDLEIEASYSTLWDNLNGDPEESRLTDNLIGIKATYALSTWPYSSISTEYQAGRRESSLEPDDKKKYRGDVDIISIDFYASGDMFSLSLGASLEESSNELRATENDQQIYSYISASYFSSGLYITPSFYTSNSYYNNSSYIYETFGSALSLSYIPPKKPYSFSIYVNHDRSKSNDQYTYNDAFFGGISLDWKMKLSHKNEQIWTFKIENSSYVDHVYSESSSSDLFAGITWRLVSF